MTGQKAFSAILVLDVSRWGRFPNADQSAHYEFLCLDAGVAVEYCAEPFENDGSMERSYCRLASDSARADPLPAAREGGLRKAASRLASAHGPRRRRKIGRFPKKRGEWS
ncbi:MAG: hypothetical protein EOR46_30210 [Mesorhizobium sp.]|nr:MAG: hypothetical protein EOR46_30210 [Mesorhizobium sp.]RWK61899.1 MAG: hypothetical protein EOR54_32540 [Mesorhizobium sp.]RWK72159.1 MAG: hypothetical protein EOR50_29945 [Mesorhizobium sp.]RWK75018.1 MAG: hypothetical protein EOR51_32765 [Mesorhizobium sp.]RWK99600.1 MAG: hypothetical protein EOR55_31945 [Mesorhizobium sp.]